MLFMTSLDIIPGKAEEMIFLSKKIKTPEGIKIQKFLKLFGKPDFVIIYDAPDESTAMNFVLNFTACSVPKTSLCSPVDRYGQ